MSPNYNHCMIKWIICNKFSGVGVTLKVGINIEKSEGMGSGKGLYPPQFGVWGLATEKKINFALKKYAILSKFCYFFPILQHKNLPAHQRKWGGLSPVLKVGDLSPVPLLRPLWISLFVEDIHRCDCTAVWFCDTLIELYIYNFIRSKKPQHDTN